MSTRTDPVLVLEVHYNLGRTDLESLLPGSESVRGRQISSSRIINSPGFVVRCEKRRRGGQAEERREKEENTANGGGDFGRDIIKGQMADGRGQSVCPYVLSTSV